MEKETLKIRITGTSELLGSMPFNKEIFTSYIATKTKTEEEKERAKKDVEGIVDEFENKATGFYRDEEGKIILKGYQFKGFLKSAAKALKDSLGLKSAVSKIDTYVFVEEVNIPFMRDGKRIENPDGYLERPLRGETPQGPRTALAKSEIIKEGYTCDLTITVLKNDKTAKSCAIDIGVICDLLDYGRYNGLLQWRNSGKGAFTWEEIKD